MKKINHEETRYEVVERYCPRCGENVAMKRNFGNNRSFQCMNYETCKENKDGFCKENGVL